MKTQSIGKERAIKLADSKWWEGKTHLEIAKFQFFIEELCCPFDIFQEAMKKTLGRPVFTHEFATNKDELEKDLLTAINKVPWMF